MKVAICVEKSGGVSFFGKRLSRDSAVSEKLLFLVGEGKLCLNESTAKLFNKDEKLKISSDFSKNVSCDDICFFENTDFSLSDVTELYLFKWNRDYPADVYLEFDPINENFKKIKTEDFVGCSHKKITLEIYRRI